MNRPHRIEGPTEESPQSASAPLQIVKRPRWYFVFGTMLALLLLAATVVALRMHLDRMRREQAVDKAIWDIQGKWGRFGKPVLADVPNDTHVRIRDDFEFIDVSDVHPTDDLRQRLSRLRRVEWLALSAETTAADLRWIGKMTQLRGLSLAGADLTGADFLHLQNLQSLQLLDLSGARVPDTIFGLSRDLHNCGSSC